MVIDHVEADEQYQFHATPLLYGFQSYISVPIIRKDGSFFGTLCAIDPKPAKLQNTETVAMFNLFAELISFHLEAIEKVAASEAKLLEEQKTAELREQFIAILGHDLRNPLGSVIMGAQLLSDLSVDEEVHLISKTIKNSSHRMAGLIDNILDFARGRLGEGITLNKQVTTSLDKTFNQVMAELQTIWPNRVIEINFDLQEAVNCDTNRVAQLFSNLLGNAIVHGKPDTPIRVNALSNKKQFKLSITNYGDPIDHDTLNRLFQPFYRGADRSGKNGLGLGLYIANEIAKAHEGELSVLSINEKTCFTLFIPVKD